MKEISLRKLVENKLFSTMVYTHSVEDYSQHFPIGSPDSYVFNIIITSTVLLPKKKKMTSLAMVQIEKESNGEICADSINNILLGIYELFNQFSNLYGYKIKEIPKPGEEVGEDVGRLLTDLIGVIEEIVCVDDIETGFRSIMVYDSLSMRSKMMEGWY